ncbi:MAG: TonB-dependent receptor domain-containing protein [Salibacteraceae bacterium]
MSGYHGFGINDRLNIKWSYMLNNATSKEPDRRQLVWFYNEGDTRENYLLNVRDLNDNHRFYSDLDETENTVMTEVNYKLKWDHDEVEKTLMGITLGVNQKVKERLFDFWQYNFRFEDFANDYPDGIDTENPDSFLNDEFHDQLAFRIEELANPASDYRANLDIAALYGQFDAYVLPNWQVILGARLELGDQKITFRDQVTPTIIRVERINENYILPSFISKYEFSEKAQLRAAASQTISRPGFKEVAPFQYIEFFAGEQIVGNPDLINGTNTNFDLKYERYPNNGELIAVTAFAKTLTNPIEKTRIATASGQLSSYVNSESATVAGLELELRKKLSSFYGDSTFLGAWSVGFNASYLYSQVTIGDSVTVGGATAIQTNNDRPLQGASPYLVNLDLTYDKRFSERYKTTVTLSYNVFGRRLNAVGAQGIGDIYELPVNTVNIVWQNKLGEHLGVRFSARNILNPAIKREQEAGEPGRPNVEVNSFRRGAVYGVSLTYDIF